MLYWTFIFLCIALVAGFFGFGGVAGASAGIAQLLFYGFLILFLASIAINVTKEAHEKLNKEM